MASIPEEGPLAPAVSAERGAPAGGAPTAELSRVLRALARTRAGGALLHALEWAAYEQALGLGRCAEPCGASWRMDPSMGPCWLRPCTRQRLAGRADMRHVGQAPGPKG